MSPANEGPLSRRALLGGAIAGAAGLAACRAQRVGDQVTRTAGLAAAGGPLVFPEPEPAGAPRGGARGRVPAAFVGHGAPFLATDPVKGGDLARWAASVPAPTAIVVVSAHWEQAPATIGATTPVPLVYDFYGFPDELYRLTYPSPGAPRLADDVERRLVGAGLGPVQRDPGRGLDHGAWVPLKWLYPRADVPVLPLSLPTSDPARLLSVGRALSTLRDEGVLVLGSGNLVHNLRRLGGDGDPTPSWASEFDAWCAAALAARDLDALLDWTRKAPAPRVAHPTAEHWIPIYVALGAGLGPVGRETGDAVRFPVTGFEGASISRRCVQIG